MGVFFWKLKITRIVEVLNEAVIFTTILVQKTTFKEFSHNLKLSDLISDSPYFRGVKHGLDYDVEHPREVK